MDKDQKRAPRGFKREEGMPKNGFGEDLNYRIKGLEQAKLEPGMTAQDIAALDRVIAKLKTKQAEKKESQPAPDDSPY